MTDFEIYNKLTLLPDDLKKEAKDFIEFLIAKKEEEKEVEETKEKRPLGLAKGLIHMSDDFDEPLDDFKEYKM